MLENLARHHSEQTHYQAENLATLLEPALLLITGTIVGVLVVAMYLPIFIWVTPLAEWWISAGAKRASI